MADSGDAFLSYDAFWSRMRDALQLDDVPRREERLAAVGIDSLGIFELSLLVSELASSPSDRLKGPLAYADLEPATARELTGNDVYLYYVETKTPRWVKNAAETMGEDYA